MKVRAQIAMVLNLDKCIGCHTCSITCKNVWTNREGVEYAWFNNVETKPGIGYPKDWENQERWKGGWVRKKNGKIQPRQGAKWRILSKIFANPHLPEIDDFYEPYTFEYEWLQSAPELQAQPTARPRSLLTGERLDKIEWSGNWEDMLGGEFSKRSADYNFQDVVEKEIYGQFEKTFMMYLPRLCEHCLNPTCLASCPSGAIYKRAEDGIVLIDQEKCRGWRMCVSGCPYKKIYYNWSTGKSEKCIFCYPRIETGQPTVRSETCVGRIRYLGVVLYDADKIEAAASVEDPKDLYPAQLGVFLDPHSIEVQEAARREGIPEQWLEAATRSPVYKMAMEWKIAFPLHPEYRTLPMVWYVPPLSPIQSAAEAGKLSAKDGMPDVRSLRIPMRYLANLLTAGDEEPIAAALERMLAMRAYMRAKSVEGRIDESIPAKVGLTRDRVEEMYKIMALAAYEDRYVIPTARREIDEDAYVLRGASGFGFREGTTGKSKTNLFGGGDRSATRRPKDGYPDMKMTLRALSVLLGYPSAELQANISELENAFRSEHALARAERRRIEPLLQRFREEELLDLQSTYSELFDRSRSLSLHLFEHVHGDSRERGQAMIDLGEQYMQSGFFMDSSELPDFVPVFLEFASCLPVDEAREMLAQPAHVFAALAERLDKRGSDYASIFHALVSLAAARPDAEAVAGVDNNTPSQDAPDVDGEWEEAPISFSAGAAYEMGGPTGVVAKIRASNRPVSKGADA